MVLCRVGGSCHGARVDIGGIHSASISALLLLLLVGLLIVIIIILVFINTLSKDILNHNYH